MPDTSTAVLEPSLINEPSKTPSVPMEPETKLFGTDPTPKAPEPKVEEPTPAGSETPPKTEEPKAEPKTPSTEAEANASKAPIDYEGLKLPEGSLLSAAELAAVKQEAKKQGLTLDEAQGVLGIKNDAVKALLARQNEALVKARQDWKASWLKDPEYGGDKAAESTELAKRAWDKLADNELRTLADQTGFGDHPAVLRMMTRVGRILSEDQMVRGSVGGAPKQKSAEEILYGGTTPNADEPMS